MASDGVRLVERLRLGERPLDPDWQLASAILSLRDAASGFLVSAGDLLEDRDKASKRLRFLVRIQLLALAADRLDTVIGALGRDLEAYFDLRAEDEDDDSDHDERDAASTRAPVESIRNEVTVVLEAGGIAPEDAQAIGDTIESIRLDCAWLDESLATFVDSDPDVDRSLDYCGDLEARFTPEILEVANLGRLAAALLSALDRVDQTS